MSDLLKLLVATEVAQMTRSSVRHVRAKTASGELPHLRFGRKVLYPESAIKEWVEQQQAQAAQQTRPVEAPLPTVSGRRIRPARQNRVAPVAVEPVEMPRSASGRRRPVRPDGVA